MSLLKQSLSRETRYPQHLFHMCVVPLILFTYPDDSQHSFIIKSSDPMSMHSPLFEKQTKA